MKSVILQDVFSNLLLSVLMLAILALVLVGRPDDRPPATERCRLPETNGGDIVLAFSLPSSGTTPGKILWSRAVDDPQSGAITPVSQSSFVALMWRGCAADCRVCDPNEVPTLTTTSAGLSLKGCRPQSCRRAGT